MNRTFCLTFFVVIFSSTLNAQTTESEAPRTFGVTAGIQSDQLDFLLPFWISDQAILAPNVGIISAEDVGTDVTIGLVFKNYLRETTGAVPFLAARGATIMGIPEDGDTIYDFILGAGFGGEYFFNRELSLGIEIQGNLSISDEGSFRFGNRGNMNFNTATALTASIYF